VLHVHEGWNPTNGGQRRLFPADAVDPVDVLELESLGDFKLHNSKGKDRKSKATFCALCGAVSAAGSCRQASHMHAGRPSTAQFRGPATRSRGPSPPARPACGCLPGALAVSRASAGIGAMLKSLCVGRIRTYQTRSWFWFSAVAGRAADRRHPGRAAGFAKVVGNAHDHGALCDERDEPHAAALQAACDAQCARDMAGDTIARIQPRAA